MVMTKMALDKKQTLALINTFFNQFQTCLNRPAAPTLNDFQKILSNNFQISSNGQVKSKNLQEYLTRLQKLQQKYSHVELSSPIHEPLISDNKVAVVYHVDLTPRAGKKAQYYFMAIGTIEDNQFISWEQVTHAKNEPQWDS